MIDISSCSLAKECKLLCKDNQGVNDIKGYSKKKKRGGGILKRRRNFIT